MIPLIRKEKKLILLIRGEKKLIPVR